MRIKADFLHDPALLLVLDAIEAGGHRALMVGGCVRNAVLGHPVSDVDIATDARPDQVMALAKAAGLRAVPTGIDHGTVTVIAGGKPFEITTFRRDVETDGRHAVVAFSDDLADDAARRDFTMNALYAQRDGSVIDPVNGWPDLRRRDLRFVGDPAQRLREDYLRILRFFRFFAWYAQTADPAGLAACAAAAPGLRQISAERIGAEMRKLLAAPGPAPAVAMMDQAGVLAVVLPGADAAALARLIALEGDRPPSWPRRLAALGGADAATALRLSRAEAKAQDAMQKALAADLSLAEAGFRLGADNGVDYALIRAARAGADLPPDWEGLITRAAASLLPISAADLMPDLSGPTLGRGLRAAETLWIVSDFTATRTDLIAAAKGAPT